MLYPGAQLIRTDSQQQERIQRLKVVPQVKPADSPQKQGSHLDEQTQSALLRFARFVNGEKPKVQPKSEKPGKKNHPYSKHAKAVQRRDDCGQVLDIYV